MCNEIECHDYGEENKKAWNCAFFTRSPDESSVGRVPPWAGLTTLSASVEDPAESGIRVRPGEPENLKARSGKSGLFYGFHDAVLGLYHPEPNDG
jgi:hypothetical protein